MDDRDLFRRSNAFAREVLARIDDEALDRPSACEGWDVREAVNHLVGGQAYFLSLAEGQELDASQAPPDFAGQGIAADVLADLGARLHDAYAPERLGEVVSTSRGDLPLGLLLKIATMENVLHAWDAASGAGVDATIPDELAEPLAGFVAQVNADGSSADFAAPREVGDDASAHERLLAVAGRRA